MKRILIVDDDTTLALMLRTWLTKKGFAAESVAGATAARQRLGAEAFDLVLTDMRLPDGDGIDLLHWIGGERPALPVIVMTGYAELRNAVQSMKAGARDYIAKPVRPDELLAKIEEALADAAEAAATEQPRPNAEPAGAQPETGGGFIEGRSDAARKLYDYVRLVAPTPMSVLIHGASGTGKEHIARLIHARSPRAAGPFVAIDCGTIPRELAASEFFGHLKGSFTGAVSDKTGAFEAADGGTLFLDEVGNLALETQVQLLRALQERRIRPVGGSRDVAVDIRVIAATNERLDEAVARGSFRTDLYHRLDEFSLRMPELREIPADIPLFAEFFLDQANRELGRRVVGFDAGALAALAGCDWPGNLRQLKNAVSYATLLCEGDYITRRELPREVVDTPPASCSDSALLHDPDDEERRIRRALEAAEGNKSRAAKRLGIDRKTLYNKLRLYGIE